MRKAQMVTLQANNGLLITFDTSVSCPQSFGLEAGFKDEDCKYENCDKCWEKAIEQIADISTRIYCKKEV